MHSKASDTKANYCGSHIRILHLCVNPMGLKAVHLKGYKKLPCVLVSYEMITSCYDLTFEEGVGRCKLTTLERRRKRTYKCIRITVGYNPVIAVAAFVSFDIFNKRLLYCIVLYCIV